MDILFYQSYFPLIFSFHFNVLHFDSLINNLHSWLTYLIQISFHSNSKERHVTTFRVLEGIHSLMFVKNITTHIICNVAITF